MKIRDEKIQENVIRATEKLYLKQGINGWNMDTVARESGLAKNTLYKIIGSKEQLVVTIVIGRLRHNVDEIVGIFEKEKDFVKAVETGAHRLARSISMDNPLALPAVFREYPSIKETFDEISRELSTSIHGHLNRARKAGHHTQGRKQRHSHKHGDCDHQLPPDG